MTKNLTNTVILLTKRWRTDSVSCVSMEPCIVNVIISSLIISSRPLFNGKGLLRGRKVGGLTKHVDQDTWPTSLRALHHNFLNSCASTRNSPCLLNVQVNSCSHEVNWWTRTSTWQVISLQVWHVWPNITHRLLVHANKSYRRSMTFCTIRPGLQQQSVSKCRIKEANPWFRPQWGK